MSNSYSTSESTTFTVTHARHISARVATDLKRIQRLYNGVPSDTEIANYETELTELLKAGYVHTVTYGFKLDGRWIEPTLRYAAEELVAGQGNDDDPGKIKPGANVDGASFTSYLTYSGVWSNLSADDRHAFKSRMPFYRQPGDEPGINGYLLSDRTYASGGRALNRTSVRGI